DATSMAATIQQLFLGSTTFSPTGVSGTTGGFPGGGGGVPGLGGLGGGLGAGGARPLLPLTLGGTNPEGAPLIELRISVDTRTNSVVVAGSRNDLDVIEAIITRLEDSDVQIRRNEVYRLQNSTAVDVANALNSFLSSSLAVIQRGGQ